MLARLPERKQRGSEAERPFRVSRLDQIIERGAEVIVFDLKTTKPFRVRGHILRAFFCEHEVISGMSPASASLVVALSQAFVSVFPNGGKGKEARFRIRLLHLQRQALIHH